MNRFDRVTSLLLLLQTRSVVTAGYLSEHFSVTERTIYRDIRTLENAGVPIGSEAGIGYFLEKGYRLPPVSFTLDEAASLLLGEKLLSQNLDQESHADYTLALNKVRAVLDHSDKDYLSALDADVEVQTGSGPGSQTSDADKWLRECRRVLVRRQVVRLEYAGANNQTITKRDVEPIGLFHYSAHWHLIGWCRLRKDYRDFRLDRIQTFESLSEQFPRHSRDTLQDYLAKGHTEHTLVEVELLFTPEAARYVGEMRYLFGFVEEERLDAGIRMTFMTHVPLFMARWLLQYTGGVQVLKGEGLVQELKELSKELLVHWDSQPS